MRIIHDIRKNDSWVNYLSLRVYLTGSGESFSISHASLRFVYHLGQRYNVEMIHARLSLCSTEECFFSEIALVINKSGLFTDHTIHLYKNSLVFWLTGCSLSGGGAGSSKSLLLQALNTMVCSVMPSL